MDPALAAAEAESLRAAARFHKRAQAAHRRKARGCMDALRRLQDRCRTLGIDLNAKGRR